MTRTALLAALSLAAGPALAGTYAGVQLGATRTEDAFDVFSAGFSAESEDRSTAPDLALMVGYDFDALPIINIAVEAEAGLSTGKLVLDDIPGYRQETKNRFNYLLSVRPGVSIGPGLSLYGIAGYGQYRAKVSAVSTGGPVGPPSSGTVRYWDGGKVFGAGVRLDLPIGPFVRLEYRHRDRKVFDANNQVMLGAGWRF
jgi:opacity protein-like surface antigen